MSRFQIGPPILLLALLVTACTGLPSVFGTGPNREPTVQKAVVTLGPTPAPLACSALPEGMTLAVTPQPTGRVTIAMTGLQPGERPTLLFETAEAPGHATRIEAHPAQPVDDTGRFEWVETGLRLLPGRIENRWQLKVVHARGVACREIVLERAVGDGIFLTGYRLSAPGPIPGEPLLVTLHWRGAGAATADRVAFARLLDREARVQAADERRLDLDAAIPAISTAHWLTLPPEAAGETYTLVAGWRDGGTGAEQRVSLAPLTVVRPTPLPVVAGALADFPPGSVTPVELPATFVDPDPAHSGSETPGETYQPPEATVAPIPIYLVHEPAAGFLALYNRDPHRGCRVQWVPEAGQFLNPCHGERYTRRGEYVAGPSPRGLDRFPVMVEGEQVTVDVSHLVPGPPPGDELAPAQPPAALPLATATAQPGSLVAPDAATRQAIQAVLDREVRAWQDRDRAAFEALLDPGAPDASRREQLRRFGEIAAPRPERIEARRVLVTSDTARGGQPRLALAAVIQSEDDSGYAPQYTLRYLRELPDGWRLTAPSAAPWGARRTLRLAHVHLTYHEFDEPDVQAAAAGLDAYVAQVANDFGVPLSAGTPLALSIVPQHTPLWDQTTGTRIPATLSRSFFLDQAASPAEYLALQLYEALALDLIRQVAGPAWPAQRQPLLLWMLVRWEADQASGRLTGHDIPDAVRSRDERLPLAVLLDPMRGTNDLQGGEASQQLALLTFIVETYGRQALGALARAFLTQPDWQAVVRQAFGEDPARFEQRWQAWAEQTRTASAENDAPARTVEAYLHHLVAASHDGPGYARAYALLTPQRRAGQSLEAFSALWQARAQAHVDGDPAALAGVDGVWVAGAGEVRATLVWTARDPRGEPVAWRETWRITVEESPEGWRVADEARVGSSDAVSAPSAVEAAREFVRLAHGARWLDSVQVLLDAPWDAGRVVIVRFTTGPNGAGAPAPRAVLLYAEPDAEGWQVRGGGYIGTYAPLGRYDVATAWTWLRVDEVYAFYGVVERPDIARIELVEADGTRHTAEVGFGRAFFFPRTHAGGRWPAQQPAALRAYDAGGRELALHTVLDELGVPQSFAPGTTQAIILREREEPRELGGTEGTQVSSPSSPGSSLSSLSSSSGRCAPSLSAAVVSG